MLNRHNRYNGSLRVVSCYSDDSKPVKKVINQSLQTSIADSSAVIHALRAEALELVRILQHIQYSGCDFAVLSIRNCKPRSCSCRSWRSSCKKLLMPPTTKALKQTIQRLPCGNLQRSILNICLRQPRWRRWSRCEREGTAVSLTLQSMATFLVLCLVNRNWSSESGAYSTGRGPCRARRNSSLAQSPPTPLPMARIRNC